MAKTYSIKTVDGSRFDWTPEDGADLMNELNEGSMINVQFIGLPVGKEIKWFNQDNIVCITEMTVEEE